MKKMDKFKLIKTSMGMVIVLSTVACGKGHYETSDNAHNLQEKVEIVDDKDYSTSTSSKVTTTTSTKKTSLSSTSKTTSIGESKKTTVKGTNASGVLATISDKVKSTDKKDEVLVTTTKTEVVSSDEKNDNNSVADDVYVDNNVNSNDDFTTGSSESDYDDESEIEEVVTTEATTEKKVVTTTEVIKTEPVEESEPEPVVEEPVVYNPKNYCLEDIKWSVDAYRHYAMKFCIELYNGTMVDHDYGITAGYPESVTLLAILNYDQGISPEVLNDPDVLGNYSKEEFVQYANQINFSYLQYKIGTRIDFRDYVLNEELADYLNDIDDKWFDFVENGNEEAYCEIADSLRGNPVDNMENYMKYALGFNAYYYASDDSFYSTFLCATEIYDESFVEPFYDSFQQCKGKSYSKTMD